MNIGYNYTFSNNTTYFIVKKLYREMTELQINCVIQTYRTTDKIYIAFHFEDDNEENIIFIQLT